MPAYALVGAPPVYFDQRPIIFDFSDGGQAYFRISQIRVILWLWDVLDFFSQVQYDQL